MSSLYEIVSIGIALVCAGWCIFIFGLQTTGLTRLWLSYSSKPPKPAVSPTMDLDDLPHVTVIRPVKGLEPELYNCLAATFRQTYPREKLTIFFCVASASDPSYPVLKQLLEDFPAFDATILEEQEDPNLSGHGGQKSNLGPNPKIRNMSRAYREAKGDIVWIIDCNVWVGKGVGGRMVDKLCGFKASGERTTPYKLVHLLPIVVDTVGSSVGKESQGLSHSCTGEDQKVFSTNSSAYDISSVPKDESPIGTMLRMGGGRLEEMYMASSHGKFYTGINTAAVVPCIVGKSTMFRRSHLNALTSGSSLYSPGIDYFSDNICEDHLFGDLLWFKKVPEEEAGAKFKKHGMLLGDLAIQPMAGMSVKEYIARRVRWLRVRKWTVMFATLIEPGIEPFLCSSYGAFAATTLPWFETYLSIPPTWQSCALIWITTVTIWLLVDTHVYSRLHSGCTVEVDDNTPSFARRRDGHARRPPAQWLLAWFGRETLTLPIWLWACLGGTSVMWRGRKFRVGLDTKVKEIKIETTATHAENGRIKNKDRND